MRRTFSNINDVATVLRELDDRVTNLHKRVMLGDLTPVAAPAPAMTTASGSTAETLGPLFAKLNQAQIFTTLQTFKDGLYAPFVKANELRITTFSPSDPFWKIYSPSSTVLDIADSGGIVMISITGGVMQMVLNGNTIPNNSATYSLGSAAFHWLNGYIDNLVAATLVASGNISTTGGIYVCQGLNGVSQTVGRFVTLNTVTLQYKDWSSSNQSATVVVSGTTASDIYTGGIKTT